MKIYKKCEDRKAPRKPKCYWAGPSCKSISRARRFVVSATSTCLASNSKTPRTVRPYTRLSKILSLEFNLSAPVEDFKLPSHACISRKMLRGNSMATRTAVRYVSRRFSSSGKILSEEEKAAENKIEQEKLEKLARKQGPKPEEKSAAASSEGASGSVNKVKPEAQSSSTPGVSTDKYRNYAVVAGIVTGLGALGWYMLSKDKKTEEVHD
ncbi:hypothetical protein M9H77_16588 [Catharanthus roseus]|uniref:Uncharacterized protein n=1 Tax=Catharanthus roseus TaxID=4058 RepID=A0ACC0B271_CATRO|nr:hypothetical protein M9H77_16588 [Catharanthus roseus]